MRRVLRDNGISLFFGAILLGSLIGQSFAGLHQFNAEALEHHSATYSWSRYVTSSEFGGDVLENWQSEFLQFFLYITATVWLLQRGSSESKSMDDSGLMSDQSQLVGGYAKEGSPPWARLRGLRRRLYENSLALAMLFCFFGSWVGQSVADWRAFNHDQLDHDSSGISYGEYWANADFWDRSLQNWQSEFLAIGAMAVFTIYLRQRGSPESKPVGAPHDETGSSN
jgi:Domain of unknown function (DUF6766)